MKERLFTFLRANYVFILILFLGFSLRFYNLGGQGLWKDEIFSAIESQKSLGQLLTTKSWSYYGYAPVHYVFTHIALFFGNSDFTVRFPAALLGSLTLVVVYLLTNSIFGQKTGILAVLLLALSPIHLQYSREVRYYSYLVFFSGLTLLSTYKIVAEKKKSKWVFLFLLSTLFNLATQLTALLVLSSEAAFFALMLVVSAIKKRKTLLKGLTFQKKSLIKKVVLSTAAIPILLLAARFIGSFKDFLQTTTIKPVMPPFDFVKSIFISLSGSRELALLLIPLLILSLITGFRRNKDGQILLILALFLPTTIIYFFRPAALPGFHIRYLIFTIVPYLGLVSIGLLSLMKFPPLFFLYLVSILFFSYSPLKNYYSSTMGDWRGVANFIKANGERGDVVIPDGDYNVMLLDYYLKADGNGFVIKKPIAPLDSQVIPFRVFYFQHDYQKPDGTINLGELFITDYEKAVSFKADISPMHVAMSFPIYFWQEAEKVESNLGWSVLDFYGQKLIRIDTADLEKAIISYKIEVPQDGMYSLYANLRLDNLPGALKYRLDDEKWSDGFQPKWERVGARTKEVKLGSFYLDTSEHQLSFKNQNVGEAGRDQAIDYFYLIKDNPPE